MAKSTALVKAAVKASGKGAKKSGRLKKAIGDRRVERVSIQQTELNQGIHHALGHYDAHTGHVTRGHTFTGPDGTGGRTVHAEGLSYEGPGRTRQIMGLKATNIERNPEDGFIRRSNAGLGVQHNRYNHSKRTGKETTWSLKPSWMGGWDYDSHHGLVNPKIIDRTVKGAGYKVKQRVYQPVNAVNAGIGAYVGLVGLAIAATPQAKHTENKVSHQFYTRKRNGKTQRVKNPNYLRRVL